MSSVSAEHQKSIRRVTLTMLCRAKSQSFLYFILQVVLKQMEFMKNMSLLSLLEIDARNGLPLEEEEDVPVDRRSNGFISEDIEVLL